jgi:flagellar hook-length control protein FliK
MLKPESLGNMRLKFNIQDNNIAGKIFVENNIVKALIENSLHNLYDALKEDGFSQAMINVFVGSEGEQGKTKGNDLEGASHANNQYYWEDESALDRESIQFDSLVNIVL